LVGASVTDAPNDNEQLVPTLAAVSPMIESVGTVFGDSGHHGGGRGEASRAPFSAFPSKVSAQSRTC
jgi:hypothetical protein